MIIVVTGACGFIGSNLVKALNALGYKDIIAVDDLASGHKVKNIANCDIMDYIDKDDFLQSILAGNQDNQIDYIFHQGACSDTTNQDGKYMMKNNYEYSSILLEYAQTNEIPLVYASSAATYGSGSVFVEERQYELPLNVYGYSKFLFDQLVRRYVAGGLSAPIVGLKYFNVYGKNEWHKERMASVIWHNHLQYQEHGKVKLFAGCQGYGNGMQTRDFVSVSDVVKVNLHFFKNHINDVDEVSGIFNCGTGKARTFNDLAAATINANRALKGQDSLSLSELTANGIIEYIPFPADLAGKYQCFTEANLTKLRNIGVYKDEFMSLEDGVLEYISAISM